MTTITATTTAAAQPELLSAITIMGSGRIGPTVAALIGLGGVAVGARSLVRRRAGSGDGSSGGPVAAPAVAVGLGTLSLALGILFAANADGGPGTGNGVVASVAAMLFGPVAIVLGGLALRVGGRRAARARL